MVWKYVDIFEKCCASLAILINFIVLYLVIFKSPKQIGGYKALLIYITLFELFYSVLNSLSPTEAFTTESGFIVVMDQRNSFLPVNVFIVLFFTMYGTSLVNFAVHFIFRYLAMIGEKKLTSSEPLILIMWISIPLFLGSVYTVALYYFMSESKVMEQFLRKKMLDISPNVTITELSYMGFYMYPIDGSGSQYINWHGISGVLVVSSVITTSLSIMFYFGVKCRIQLKELANMSTVSDKYNAIQHQLFAALVLQTVIPLILMHMPSLFIALTCFVDSSLKSMGPICCVCIALYTVLDPLPNIFVIRSYRKAFLNLIRCNKSKTTKRSTIVPTGQSTIPTSS